MGPSYRRCFHEVTVVKKNCIHFALRFSSLPSLRENKDDMFELTRMLEAVHLVSKHSILLFEYLFNHLISLLSSLSISSTFKVLFLLVASPLLCFQPQALSLDHAGMNK